MCRAATGGSFPPARQRIAIQQGGGTGGCGRQGSLRGSSKVAAGPRGRWRSGIPARTVPRQSGCRMSPVPGAGGLTRSCSVCGHGGELCLKRSDPACEVIQVRSAAPRCSGNGRGPSRGRCCGVVIAPVCWSRRLVHPEGQPLLHQVDGFRILCGSNDLILPQVEKTPCKFVDIGVLAHARFRPRQCLQLARVQPDGKAGQAGFGLAMSLPESRYRWRDFRNGSRVSLP